MSANPNEAWALHKDGVDETGMKTANDIIVLFNEHASATLGTWTDEEKANEAANKIKEALNTSDRQNAFVGGCRQVSLTEAQFAEYLKAPADEVLTETTYEVTICGKDARSPSMRIGSWKSKGQADKVCEGIKELLKTADIRLTTSFVHERLYNPEMEAQIQAMLDSMKKD